MKRTETASKVSVIIASEGAAGGELAGKKFPCPTCGVAIRLRFDKNGKPYCVCLDCGNQLFFRGRTAIARLTEIVKSGKLSLTGDPSQDSPVALFDRLAHLRQQKKELQEKQRFMRNDPDLKKAIQATDIRIRSVQDDLHNLADQKPERRRRIAAR